MGERDAHATERGAFALRMALFPLSYAAHIGEELWSGEAFPGWFSRVFEARFDEADFLSLNLTTFAAMCGAATLAWRSAPWRWLQGALAAVVLINTLAHVLGSLATRSYCPGLLTAVVLWAPLGVVALRRCARTLERRRFWLALGAGACAHALVTIAALNL